MIGVIGGASSARTTLGLLAAVGALCGGVAGAVVAVRLSADDALPAAVARDEPAAFSADRGSSAGAVASRSALHGPTPWPVAEAKIVRVRHPHHRAAPVRKKRHRVAVRAVQVPVRTTAAAGTQQAAGSTGAAAPAPVQVPQTYTPTRSPQATSAPVAKTTPRAPSPEPAPAHANPKPEPAGRFDDSG